MSTPTARRAGIVAASALLVFALRSWVPGSAGLGVAFLFSIPAGLAAWWFGRAWGLATAAVTMGLYLLSTLIQPPVGNHVSAFFVRAVIVFGATLIVAELRDRTQRLTVTSLELEAIREALTPSAVPTLPGLDIAVRFIGAEHEVSGDFFLVTPGPDGANVILVGDVCGHGLHAAQRATFARATLASIAASSQQPGEILTLANHIIAGRWAGHESWFLTVVCVVHDPATGTITWASAGHSPPLRLRDAGDLPSAHRAQLPLGMDRTVAYRDNPAGPDDAGGILLYTDGITEARRHGEQFGDRRLRNAVGAHRDRDADTLAGALADEVHAFAPHLPDDVCLVVVRSTTDTRPGGS